MMSRKVPWLLTNTQYMSNGKAKGIDNSAEMLLLYLESKIVI